MLRLDPEEAPAPRSVSHVARAHLSSTTGKHLGRSELSPRGTSGIAALQSSQISTWTTSRRSWKLPACCSCERSTDYPHKKPLGAHSQPGIKAELHLEAIEVTPWR